MNFFYKFRKKPNLIFILLDGIRLDYLSKIPYFNDLKKKTTFFSQLITYAPYTVASFHSLFSGMTGKMNGVNGYYNAYSFDKKNCKTITQYFKDAGYFTLGDFLHDHCGPSQGFDIVMVHDEYNDDLVERHSEILTRLKIKKPFFAFLHYSKIHAQLVTNVAKKYSDMDKEYFDNIEKNKKNYQDSVEKSSKYVKSIIDKIKELDLYDDSIIFIMSDHGTSVGDKYGEKMYGVYLYDYTLKCFLYMIGKKVPKGLEIKNLIRNIDVLPTIMDICKIKENKNFKHIQGRSFLPFLKGKFDKRVAYSETGGLGGPFPSPEIHNLRSIRTDNWKLIINLENNTKELYNLEKDKNEENNLVEKETETVNKLEEEMKKWTE